MLKFCTYAHTAKAYGAIGYTGWARTFRKSFDGRLTHDSSIVSMTLNQVLTSQIRFTGTSACVSSPLTDSKTAQTRPISLLVYLEIHASQTTCCILHSEICVEDMDHVNRYRTVKISVARFAGNVFLSLGWLNRYRWSK